MCFERRTIFFAVNDVLDYFRAVLMLAGQRLSSRKNKHFDRLLSFRTCHGSPYAGTIQNSCRQAPQRTRCYHFLSVPQPTHLLPVSAIVVGWCVSRAPRETTFSSSSIAYHQVTPSYRHSQPPCCRHKQSAIGVVDAYCLPEGGDGSVQLFQPPRIADVMSVAHVSTAGVGDQ